VILNRGKGQNLHILFIRALLLPWCFGLAQTLPSGAPAGNVETVRSCSRQYGCYQCHGYAAQAEWVRDWLRAARVAAFSEYLRQPAGEMPPYTGRFFPTVNCGRFAFLRSLRHRASRQHPASEREGMKQTPDPILRGAVLASPSIAQNRQPSLAAGAAMADDESTSAHPGEKGHWIRQGRAQTGQQSGKHHCRGPGGLSRISPWPTFHFNRGLAEFVPYRQANFERDAPHSRCKPSPGPRQVGTAYGFRNCRVCGTFSACLFSTSEARIVFVSSI